MYFWVCTVGGVWLGSGSSGEEAASFPVGLLGLAPSSIPNRTSQPEETSLTGST